MTAIEKAGDGAFARFRQPSDVPSDWR
jgi:hypothetical protein